VAGKHGIQNLIVDVNLIEAGPRLLGGLSEKSSEITLKRMGELGVNIHLNTNVVKCSKTSVFTTAGKLPAEIIIWTAGNKANPLFSYYPDLFTVNARGRVQVSEYFNANSPNIFVIGDAADTPYSGMAQTAIHNAIALASNLCRAVEGQHQTAYRPKKPEYVVPVGGEWALLETNDKLITGKEGWDARRQADKWVLQNFLVYDLANKHWAHGDKIADF